MSSRGHARERAVADILRKEDWFVIRAPGSLGVADLVALKAGKRPRMIEVKSTVGPYSHFGPKDRADLLFWAEVAGADALLAWYPSRGKLRWIEPSEWPATKAGPPLVGEGSR